MNLKCVCGSEMVPIGAIVGKDLNGPFGTRYGCYTKFFGLHRFQGAHSDEYSEIHDDKERTLTEMRNAGITRH